MAFELTDPAPGHRVERQTCGLFPEPTQSALPPAAWARGPLGNFPQQPALLTIFVVIPTSLAMPKSSLEQEVDLLVPPSQPRANFTVNLQ